MKVKLPFFFFFLSFCCLHSLSAQRVFAVKSIYEADVRVYVAGITDQVDLLVCNVESADLIGKNQGRWFFVSTKEEVAKKIYFVDSPVKADLIICYVQNWYRAGWRNQTKKALMY